MNYIAEIRAYYDWLESNPQSSASCIVLWHALMFQANKTGWKAEFSVAISTLELRTGLKRGAIYTARNALKRFGIIDFRERSGNLSAVYKLVSLCLFNERKDEQAAGRTDGHTGEPLNKQSETKHINIDSSIKSSNNRGSNHRMWVKNENNAAGAPRKNRFMNYEQHVRDYDELEMLEELRWRRIAENDKGQAE